MGVVVARGPGRTTSSAEQQPGRLEPENSAVMQIKTPAFPLKVSENNRYVVDQKNQPVMLVGDSPQSIVGRMSISDVRLYLNNRRQYGVNVLWVHLLCNDKIACNADGTTYNGIPPFTTPGDLATPNSIYFDRVDEIIRLAGESGIVILLDVVETIGWLSVFKANGTAKAESFGRYVGERY